MAKIKEENFQVRSHKLRQIAGSVVIFIDEVKRVYFLFNKKLYRGMPLVGRLGKPRKNNANKTI